MKIRSDLEGVVYVHTHGGVACLAAGDTVPDGVDVGEHLTTEPDETAEDLDEVGADGSDDDKPDDADDSDTEDDDEPETDGSAEDLDVEVTEHAGRRRGRRSTARPESDV